MGTIVYLLMSLTFSSSAGESVGDLSFNNTITKEKPATTNNTIKAGESAGDLSFSAVSVKN